MNNATRLEYDISELLNNVARSDRELDQLLLHGKKIKDKRRLYLNLKIRLESIDRACQSLLKERKP